MAGGSSTSLSRDAALDGLRGWAAFSVVIYHCLWQTFGRLFPELHSFIPSILGNGLLAVATFFAISGYVLTRARWRRDDNPSLLIAFGRRYVRLALPIVVVSVLAFVLMSLSLTPTKEAHAIARVRGWYNSFANFEPDFFASLRFALLNTFAWSTSHNYNTFLWTMVIELWGSLILFATSQSSRYLREPYTPLLLVIALSVAIFPLAGAFFAGGLIALLERDGIIFRAPPGPRESAVATGVLAGIIALGGVLQIIQHDYLSMMILGVGLFLAAKRSLPALRFLNLPISRTLGLLSFPLYLGQYAVIISLGAWLLIWFDAADALTLPAALLIAALTVAASLALAVILLPVELFTLRLLKQFDRYWTGRRSAALSTAPSSAATSPSR